MKKFFSIVLAAVMCAALTACDSTDSGSKSDNKSSDTQSSAAVTKKPSEKAQELLGAVTFPEMVSKDMEFVEVTFGIIADMVTEHCLYICGSGAMPDEFGIFVASSADAAAQIKTKIDARIAYQKKTYTDYTPDEVYKFDDCFCDVDGNTVIYAICADNTKAREILK